jgi:hydroxymethylbilane synthase
MLLAAAGLLRCGLGERISDYLDPERFLPAAGQGILAVQCRRGSEIPGLAALDHPEARICAAAERAFTAALEGGCTAPTCAYATLEGEGVRLRGLYLTDSGELRRGERTAGAAQAAELGRTLARELKGAPT